MVPAAATDVFGRWLAPLPAGPVATLSVDGVRRLRSRLDGRVAAPPRAGRVRAWKVVRHGRGVDPFDRLEWVYSAHTTERAAQRARDRVRAVMARSSGEAEAARWVWSAVHDVEGSLANPSPQRDPRRAALDEDIDRGGA